MTSQITSHIKYVIPVGPGTVPKSWQICNQQSSYNKNLRAPKTVNTAAAEPLAAPLTRHLVTLYIVPLWQAHGRWDWGRTRRWCKNHHMYAGWLCSESSRACLEQISHRSRFGFGAIENKLLPLQSNPCQSLCSDSSSTSMPMQWMPRRSAGVPLPFPV